jgi:rhodanese-related sulfurtransferase
MSSHSTTTVEEQLSKHDVLIIDSRYSEEVALTHDFIGAKNMPATDIGNKLEEFGVGKSRPILVYYGSGSRTHHAEKALRDAGYTDIVTTSDSKAIEAHPQKWRVLS